MVLAGLVLMSGAASGGLAWRLIGARPADVHFANADDGLAVQRGKSVYRDRCAGCHGRYLQGQSLWQLSGQTAHRYAPAHDSTGHTWLHGDEDLFVMTREGHFPGVPNPANSAMPAFRGTLEDGDILAVIAYLKASWPTGLRVMQAMRNPNQAGLPRGVDQKEWRFPPNCNFATQSVNARNDPGGR